MNRILVPLAGLVGLVAASTGQAFPFDNSWHMPAAGDVPNGQVYDPSHVSGNNRAGAGGIYGLGSATDFGIKCSHCHIDDGINPYGLIDARIDVSPSWQVIGGDFAYSPRATYTITVVLEDEHRFATAGFDLNGMAATIEDANGQVAGVFVTDSGTRSDQCSASDPTLDPATQTTFVYGDCHGVLPVANHSATGRTSWTFDWIAPAAGAGDLTMFWAVVDGDTGGSNSLADDVKEGTLPLLEGS